MLFMAISLVVMFKPHCRWASSFRYSNCEDLILSCAQVEATAKSGEVIFHFKDAPHPARFGRARLRATRRSALAAVAQHLLGPAAAPYRAGSWSREQMSPQPPSFSAFFGAQLERNFV